MSEEVKAMSEKVKEGPYKNQKCIHCETFEQNHDDTKCQRRYPTLTDGTYVYMDSLRNVMGVGKQFDPEIEPFRCQVIDVPSIMRSSGFDQGRHSRDAEVAELRDKLKEATKLLTVTSAGYYPFSKPCGCNLPLTMCRTHQEIELLFKSI
jgi:hypothetical protein